jgi:hypothetical protein
MLIKWIGEICYSKDYGELRAGKLLEVSDQTASIWIGQGVAEKAIKENKNKAAKAEEGVK